MVDPVAPTVEQPGSVERAIGLASTALGTRPSFDTRFLDSAEAHVWSLDLGSVATRLNEFEPLLSLDEAGRAARFRFEKHRNAYIAAHGWLRQVLSLYLSMPPGALRFDYGPQGKPALAGIVGPGLQFNLSHSSTLALLAISAQARIGVDVEQIRSLPDAGELVDRFFSQREAARFRTLPESERSEAFFRLWTRKEAWLKATGEGIAHLLARVEVTFLPAEPAQLLALPDDYSRASRWSIESMVPAPQFVAAVAVENVEVKPWLRAWEFCFQQKKL